jgi:hypothetical protein
MNKLKYYHRFVRRNCICRSKREKICGKSKLISINVLPLQAIKITDLFYKYTENYGY